jgi:hypothetical protein
VNSNRTKRQTYSALKTKHEEEIELRNFNAGADDDNSYQIPTGKTG